MSLWLVLLAVAGLLLFSAIFSGAETGVYSVSRVRLEEEVQAVEPGRAHRVVEREPGGHPSLGLGGVLVVGVGVPDAETLRQRRTDGRLSGSRHAHEHDERRPRLDRVAARRHERPSA